jgi:hypothetical protein
MNNPRVILTCATVILGLASVISLVGCGGKSTATSAASTVTTTVPQATTTSTSATLQGTLTGSYSGKAPKGSESGTFSLTINSDDSVQGSYTGSNVGNFTGQVDTNGNFTASGSIGGSQVTWQGKLTRSGNSLSIQGNYSNPTGTRSGTFSGTGTISE